MVFCHKCGAQAPEDSEFCRKCGAKLITDDSTVKVEPVQKPVSVPPAPTISSQPKRSDPPVPPPSENDLKKLKSATSAAAHILYDKPDTDTTGAAVNAFNKLAEFVSEKDFVDDVKYENGTTVVFGKIKRYELTFTYYGYKITPRLRSGTAAIIAASVGLVFLICSFLTEFLPAVSIIGIAIAVFGFADLFCFVLNKNEDGQIIPFITKKISGKEPTINDSWYTANSLTCGIFAAIGVIMMILGFFL